MSKMRSTMGAYNGGEIDQNTLMNNSDADRKRNAKQGADLKKVFEDSFDGVTTLSPENRKSKLDILKETPKHTSDTHTKSTDLKKNKFVHTPLEYVYKSIDYSLPPINLIKKTLPFKEVQIHYTYWLNDFDLTANCNVIVNDLMIGFIHKTNKYYNTLHNRVMPEHEFEFHCTDKELSNMINDINGITLEECKINIEVQMLNIFRFVKNWIK